MARLKHTRKRRGVIRRVKRKPRRRATKATASPDIRLQPIDVPLLIFIGRKDLLPEAQRRLWR